jgi:hemolysin-activating ACP:hemolysin acyltransferase
MPAKYKWAYFPDKAGKPEAYDCTWACFPDKVGKPEA